MQDVRKLRKGMLMCLGLILWVGMALYGQTRGKIDVEGYFKDVKIDSGVKLDSWTRTRIAYFLYDLEKKDVVRLIQYAQQGGLYEMLGIKTDPFAAVGSIDPDLAEDMFLRFCFLDEIKSLSEITEVKLLSVFGDKEGVSAIGVQLTLKNRKKRNFSLHYNRETHLFYQSWG
ncbi:MAG: hypothetical protein N2442_12330 [Spirochaetes bacterium]|nr:hypothetical protein [Spirochaetota bacterium]